MSPGFPSPRVHDPRALGLMLGVAADALLGDPARHHPVAWFGSWATFVERRLYAEGTSHGALFTVVTLSPLVVLGVAAEPVSYTHLDVYKRQVLGTRITSEAARTRQAFSVTSSGSPGPTPTPTRVGGRSVMGRSSEWVSWPGMG